MAAITLSREVLKEVGVAYVRKLADEAVEAVRSDPDMDEGDIAIVARAAERWCGYVILTEVLKQPATEGDAADAKVAASVLASYKSIAFLATKDFSQSVAKDVGSVLAAGLASFGKSFVTSLLKLAAPVP